MINKTNDMERIELLIAKDRINSYKEAVNDLSNCTLKESEKVPFDKEADMYIILESASIDMLVRIGYLAGYYEASLLYNK